MKFETFPIDGPVLITPHHFGDERGYFMEAFKDAVFKAEVGEDIQFVQDNQSFSAQVGTVRGLHYQEPPFAQGKLVRVLQGSIIDVAVDVRSDSPTYGKHVRVELSAENKQQLWVPEGFLHGFATREAGTLVLYKVTNVYSPESDGNVRFDDPELNIDWGLKVEATLSDKDQTAPAFSEWMSPFYV